MLRKPSGSIPAIRTSRANVDGDALAGLEQVQRHRRAHVAEPDETDFHLSMLLPETTLALPVCVRKFHFEDQTARAVSSRHLDRLFLWCDQPPPLFAFAKQGGKARGRSNLGPHSQSIEPLRPTRAAVLQSSITA
jgi:hypothetical protein